MREGARSLANPEAIAAAGEEIYAEKYKKECERRHNGEFVAIDVSDGAAYRGKLAGDALMKARHEAPHGVFHLIRVGARRAFRWATLSGRGGRALGGLTKQVRRVLRCAVALDVVGIAKRTLRKKPGVAASWARRRRSWKSALSKTSRRRDRDLT